jgi:GTPase SAR1 family protein
LFKILLIGDAGTGKTSVQTRFCDNIFSDLNFASMGVDFKIKTININDKVVKL